MNPFPPEIDALLAKLPTAYAEPLREHITTLAAAEDNPHNSGQSHDDGYEHVGVLIGTGLVCLVCGKDMGIATVAFPDIDWGQWERLNDLIETTLLATFEQTPLPGLHGPTVARYLAQQLAYTLLDEFSA